MLAGEDGALVIHDWDQHQYAATLVALADTACGYGARLSLPEGSTGFTTNLSLGSVLKYSGSFASASVEYGINFDLGYAGRIGTRTWWEASIFTSVLETGIATNTCSGACDLRGRHATP